MNEMGITSRLFPAENAPNGDMAKLAACDKVADVEDDDNDVVALHELHAAARAAASRRALASNREVATGARSRDNGGGTAIAARTSSRGWAARSATTPASAP